MRSITVVGASLGGLASARALREQGFDGRIHIVGDEVHRPYDRPPLSKQFLSGSNESIALETGHDAALDIEWHLGSAAVALDCTRRSVTMASGQELVSDAVVLATGASALSLPGARGVAGVHTLRTLDDALALRESLVPGVRVVIVGAGFVGSEVASTAVEIGAEVSVIESTNAPLQRVLGAHVGRIVAGLHDRGGAKLLTGAAVRGFVTSAGRVTGVELHDGRIIGADVVLLGIGSQPNVGWLVGSGVEVADGVVTDRRGATSVPSVVAVGDCSTVRDPLTGLLTRDEHWTAAANRPAVAMKTLLSGGTSTETFSTVPYVWSDQYRTRIQFAGEQGPDCRIEIVEGDPTAGPLVAVYRRSGSPVAVLALSSPRSFGQWRRQLCGASRDVGASR
ncbi:NAD(P)/FAD-dependent oxidoreductase [Mycobacterium novum]